MLSSVGSLLREVRHALRLLGRTPGFTLPAVASLGVGIALNTVLFTVLDATLLRPLGGAAADDLVRIGRSQRNDGSFRSASVEERNFLTRHAASFAGIAGHQLESAVLVGPDASNVVAIEPVTANYFAVLDVPLALGRGFREEEDLPGAAPVLVLSDRLWRRQFAADPTVLGSSVRLNDRSFTIVGVASSGFVGTFPGVDVDAWLPARVMSVLDPRGVARDPALMLIGRLKPGVSIRQAGAELQVLARRMIDEDATRSRDRGFTLAVARGVHPAFARILRTFLLLLMGVAGVVLLISCTNVSGLLLARATVRQGELALRMALGARRTRLISQLLVESAVLAALGGIAGVLLSYWPVRLLNAFSPTEGPTGGGLFFDLRLDTRVLLFTAALAALTTVVFGVMPALRTTRFDLTPHLRDAASSGSRRRSRLREGVMVVQVALSCILLVAAGLLFRAVLSTARVELGFDPDRVVIASLDVRPLGADPQRREAFYVEVLRRVREQPWAEWAAYADFVPMGDPGAGRFRVTAPGGASESRRHEVPYGVISDQYFATVGQSLQRGRDFDTRDRSGSPLVVIVNEAFARRFFAGENALGKRVRLAREHEQEYEIVGIAGNARFWAPAGDVEPLILVPAAQHGGSATTLHVRTRVPPSEGLSRLSQLVAGIDGSVAFSGRRMRDGMQFTLVPVRIAQSVFAVAGLIGLVLAGIGLYGVVWYSLEQRVKEIGIRVALGASRLRVLRVLVGGAVRLTAAGVIIGLALAGASTQLLSAFLHGVSPTDPVTFAAIAALLMVTALAAAYAAARNGLDMDPIAALRHE